MPETTPTGEQIRFTSSVTGETILDAYLEACERGGRTLPSLLADLFDNAGAFRTDLIQFRVNAATRNLQTRAGTYANPEAGWVDLANGYVFRQRGAHANATAYEQLDVVTHNSSTYFCTVAHTSSSASPNLSNFALIIDGSQLVGLNSLGAFSLGGRAASGSFAGISIPTNTIAGRTTGDVKALTPSEAKTILSLSAVEDKSSSTIRGEITSLNVTTALGYTPYNSSNPAGYLTSITFGQVVGALGYTPLSTNAVSSVAGRTGIVTLGIGDISGAAPLASPSFTGTPTAPTAAGGTSNTQVATTAFVSAAVAAATGAVTSFNARTGAVTLTSGDVTTALGYTPSTFNPSSITSMMTSSVNGEVMRLQSADGSFFSFYRLPSFLPSGFIGQANRLMPAAETLGLRGENGIAFSGNGGASQQMALLSNGRLGVGTASPTSTIQAETSGSDSFITANRVSGTSISLIAGASNAWLNTNTNTPITFGVNGTERASLSTAGVFTSAGYSARLDNLGDQPDVILNNRGAGATGDAYRIGGVYGAAYRDVFNQAFVAGVWFERYPSAGNLASSGDIVFGTSGIGTSGKGELTAAMRISHVGGIAMSMPLNVLSPVAANSLSLGAPLPVSSGGTGGTTPAAARASLGAQVELGFTPVQQGTGVGQSGNIVKIGWSGSRLKATVDVTDQGNIVFDSHLSGYPLKSNNLSDLDSVSSARANLGLGNAATRNITTSTGGPSGGASGDIWFQVS